MMLTKKYLNRGLWPLSFLAAALTAFAANAQSVSMSQPNYTYFSGSISEYSNSQRGVNLYGQYELQNKLFLIGKYEQVTHRRDNGVRTSQSIAEAGAGRYFTILDGTTLDVSATVGRLAASQNVFNAGDNFYSLNSGINYRRSAWETRLGYRYVDLSGRDADHGVVASVYFYTAPQIAVGVEFNDVYGRSSTQVGVRFIF